MARLPELKDQLIEAAERLGDDKPRARRSPVHPRRVPLLVAVFALCLSGAAVASVAVGLLDRGAPVPEGDPSSPRTPLERGGDPPMIATTAPDPEGGPDWGLLVTPLRGDGVCLHAGRVQDGRIGVVGRDGVFGDDGKFHPLSASSPQAGVCGSKNGLRVADPPRPASGYTGPPGPPLGGCREPVDLDGPTVSPETRRKLREVPVCSRAGARIVHYGFVAADVTEVRLRGPDGERSASPTADGAFLLVAAPAELGTDTPRQLLVHDDGSVTDTLLGSSLRN